VQPGWQKLFNTPNTYIFDEGKRSLNKSPCSQKGGIFMKRYWWFAVAVPFTALLMTCNKQPTPPTPPAAYQGPEMATIPGGTFEMGAYHDSITFSMAIPRHTVTISPFSMSKTLITQGLYDTVMDTNPSHWPYGSDYPVEQMTWCEAVLFCNRLSQLVGLDTVYLYDTVNIYNQMDSVGIDYSKNGFRMPTEAEWEYAYRAGTTTDFYWGRDYPPVTHEDTLAVDSNAVWYYTDSLSSAPVASRLPNPFGLYDMAGNLFTWCNDWWRDDYSGILTQTTDPEGPADGFFKVCRGGSWGYFNCGYVESFILTAPFRWNMYLYSNGWMVGLRVVRGTH
jgi:formylglycine-generating enzyme required for sulfatase activity